MSDNTKIEWTDATWNIITGCSVVSAGCKHCYAMKLAGTRLRHDPSRAGLTVDTKAGPVWNGQVRFNEHWLDQPLRWKRPRKIFVCAHGDLFHEAVPDEWIDRVFDVMMRARRRVWLGERLGWGWEQGHTFQVLTKRPARMLAYVLARLAKKKAYADQFDNCPTEAMRNSPAARAARDGAACLPPHIWLGVSVEDQAAADERIPLLLQVPAAVRWVSAEPLLGPVDLQRLEHRRSEGQESWLESLTQHGTILANFETGTSRKVRGARIDWVVAGGESGPGARPMHPDWARSLRDQCAAAGVPFLFKQWGNWQVASTANGHFGSVMPETGEKYTWLGHDGRSQAGTSTSLQSPVYAMANVGKKRAGRELDGRTHEEYPQP